MEAILNSFFLVLAVEMGDKSQLLALVLVSRFRKPWTVMAGGVIATPLSLGLASWARGWISEHVSRTTLKWILALTFFAFSAWLLVPDKDEETSTQSRFGPFLTTV